MLEIETHERDWSGTCLGSQANTTGCYILCVVRWQRAGKSVSDASKDGRSATGLTFLLHLGKDVAVGVVSAYLYDKLKGRATKLRVDREEIQIEKNEITRIFTEHIEESSE